MAVAYSGKAGREPVFSSQAGMTAIRERVASLLIGRSLTSFRELAAAVDALTEEVTVERPAPPPELADEDPIIRPEMSRRELLTAPARFLRAVQQEVETESGPAMEQVLLTRPLHPAVRYGVSQALLAAAAQARHRTMAEVICQEWGLPRPVALVPIHAQCGGDRYHGADKMIVRRVTSLPHALVDDIPEQLGSDGGKLVQYVRWLAGRIRQLGGPNYRPTIHIDVHGALGKIFDNQPGRVLGQLGALEKAAQPYPLRVECPVMLDSRQAQMDAMRTLRDYLRFRKFSVQLVADEWANTLDDICAFAAAGAADMIQIKMPDLGGIHNAVDAVLVCNAAGVEAFLGGSCAETDLSARVSVHLALAARPAMVMAKPGMGVDEAVVLAQNEMARTLAWLQASPAGDWHLT